MFQGRQLHCCMLMSLLLTLLCAAVFLGCAVVMLMSLLAADMCADVCLGCVLLFFLNALLSADVFLGCRHV